MERNLFWKLDVILFCLLFVGTGFVFADDVTLSLQGEILVAAAQDPINIESDSLSLDNVEEPAINNVDIAEFSDASADMQEDLAEVKETEETKSDDIAEAESVDNEVQTKNPLENVVANNDLNDDDLAELERIGESVYVDDETCDALAEEEQEQTISELSNLVADSSVLQESDNAKIYRETFPLIINEEVQAEITYLTTKARGFLTKAFARAEKYSALMREIVVEYGIPEELAYLPIIESGFNYQAYSPKGAAGMWQFMPGTAKWIGMKRNEWMDERLDPVISCRYAAKYLRMLYDTFGDWYLALASYNYGGHNVKRAIRNAGTSEFYDIAAKRIIPVETQKYVPRFVASVYIIKNYEKFGLKYKEWKEDYEYYSLPFTSPVRLVAKYSGITEHEFMQLNPALRSPFVPSNKHGYQIRLPKNNMDRLKANYNALKNQSAQDYQVYYVRRGDNLSKISERFGVSQGILMSINGIVNSNRIREGQKLYIPVSYYALQKAKTKRQNVATVAANHVVARGDTLYGIALKYRTSADTLARLNRLRSPYTIRVGQVLRIK